MSDIHLGRVISSFPKCVSPSFCLQAEGELSFLYEDEEVPKAAQSLRTTETGMPLKTVNFIFWEGLEMYSHSDLKHSQGHKVLSGY